jgi:hypothetical protein
MHSVIDEVLWIVHRCERKKEPGQVLLACLTWEVDEHTIQAWSSTILSANLLCCDSWKPVK